MKTPIRTERLPWRQIDGRAVVIQPSAGKVHELNPAGTLLWSRADGTRSVEALASELAQEYGISAELARADAVEFFRSMETLGLLSMVPARPAQKE